MVGRSREGRGEGLRRKVCLYDEDAGGCCTLVESEARGMPKGAESYDSTSNLRT